jgi:hypothetical protein
MTAFPPGIVSMIRDRVRAGQITVSSHVRTHGSREAFNVAQVRQVVLTGIVIEWMSERQRILFCGRVRNLLGHIVWLHVVADYVHPITVGLVTAYMPDLTEWEEPPLRRRR